MEYGDYSLEGLEDVVAIERKLNGDELFVNLTQGKKRLLAEIERMQDCKVKVLIVEQTWEEIMNPDLYYINRKKINKRNPKMPVIVVASALIDFMTSGGIQVICAGNRAQSVSRAILLDVYKKHTKGLL